MKLKKNTYSQFFLLLTFFFVCWAAPQMLQNMRLFSGLLPQILFSIVFAVIAGTLLPLEYSRYRLLRTLPAKRNLFLSFFITLLVVFLISILSEALPGLLTTLHPIPFYVRYALLVFCISFGLWVFAFFILASSYPGCRCLYPLHRRFFRLRFFCTKRLWYFAESGNVYRRPLARHCTSLSQSPLVIFCRHLSHHRLP